MIEKNTNRIFGLDILRSIAIIIVVLGHSNLLIEYYFNNFPFISLPDGVDLFFVLSGYLIGTIIIKMTEHKQRFDLTVALNFLQRRWFRTLPNYFLFLALNIILIYFGLIKGSLNKFLITYFVFFQNFHKPYDFMFWESWSLSIEEWFYFLFPVSLIFLSLITNYKVKAKLIVLSTIIVFLFLPLFYRIFQSNNLLDWDIYFRKLVLTRLDTIGFGLLAAYIHWYHRNFWTKTKNIFFISGLVLLFFITTIDFNNTFFKNTFYFSLMGISVFLLLPKLQSLKNENIPLKPFRFISKISYSMYLIHIPLIQIISKIFIFSSKFKAILIYIMFWIILLLLSYLIFRFYERPLMNIRERIHIKLPFRKRSSNR